MIPVKHIYRKENSQCFCVKSNHLYLQYYISKAGLVCFLSFSTIVDWNWSANYNVLMGNITSCHLVLNVQNMVRIWSMLLLICYLVACSVKDLKKFIKWVFLLLNQRMYLTWAEKKGHLFFQITLGNEAKVQQWFRKHSLKTGTLHNSLMKYSVYIGAFGGHDFQTTTKNPPKHSEQKKHEILCLFYFKHRRHTEISWIYFFLDKFKG